MSNFSSDETFLLTEIAAMPRGMTLAEAEHYLMTDELPLDDPFRDISHTVTPEEREAQEAEEHANEEFDDGGLSPDEVMALLNGEWTITAAVHAFYDKNQPRWPDESPGGLGGQWRDETPGTRTAKASKFAPTKAIYRATIPDGEVVAQRGDERMRWDQSVKKFRHEKRGAAGWKSSKIGLSKKQAYEKIKKGDWHAPESEVEPRAGTFIGNVPETHQNARPRVAEADAPTTIDDVTPELVDHDEAVSPSTPEGLTGTDALDAITHPLTADDIKELNAYTGNGYNPDRLIYHALNDRLRNGPGPLDAPGNAAKAEAQVKALDDVIARGTVTQPITVWRGLEGVSDKYKDAKIGDVLSDKAYTSTSANGDIAQQVYATKPGAVVFKISVPAGTHAAKFPMDVEDKEAQDHYRRAQEVILARDQRLRVTGISTLPGSDTSVIELEVVNDSTTIPAPLPPPPPPPSSSDFRQLSHNEAVAMQRKMKQGWTDTERMHVRNFTSSWYDDVNKSLRGVSQPDAYNKPTVDSMIAGLKKIMRPSTQDVELMRGSRPQEFGVSTQEELKSLVGTTGVTKGFSSTSIDMPFATQCNDCVIIKIRAPKGTNMAYVAEISDAPNEHEMLLPPGMKYRVISAEPPSSGKGPWNVVMEVIS